MKAYVVHEPGGPEVLELEDIPDPRAEPGQILIDIRAFGLNRAEAVTRMGGSGDAVPFPKVIGIECVGTVLDCPGGELTTGQTVAAAMGGMGRRYNGSYAEKTVVPVSNVFPLQTHLDWTTLASLPETYLTARGCVIEALRMDQVKHPRVLVRPGASALGVAITQIVNHLGGAVMGVTRSVDKVEKLWNVGMKEVLVSDGPVAKRLRFIWPDGADGVVDTILSKATLADDFALKKEAARICVAGSLAGSYATSPSPDFQEVIRDPAVAFYSSEELHVAKDGSKLQEIVERVEEGHYLPYIDAIYPFGELVRAHEAMERNAFAGKVIVVLDR